MSDGRPDELRLLGPTADELLGAKVPGCVVAVVVGDDHRDGVITWAVGHDPRGAALTPDTRLQIGSTSKLVAAVAALSLVGDGVVGLDEDLAPTMRAWLPPAGARCTVRAVLSHTTGLGVHGFLGYPGQPLPSRPDVLAGRGNSTTVALEHTPGSYAYSGGAYEMLALALEERTGVTFPELVHARVFRPAGMSHSGFVEQLGTEVLPLDASGTAAFDGAPLGHDGFQHHPEHAAAGVWSTAADVARLFAALAAARAGRGSLLPADLARLMVTPTGLVDPDKGDAVGLGCFLSDRGGRRWMSHGGRNIGYCSTNLAAVDAAAFDETAFDETAFDETAFDAAANDGPMTGPPTAVVVLTNGFPGGTEVGRIAIDRLLGLSATS